MQINSKAHAAYQQILNDLCERGTIDHEMVQYILENHEISREHFRLLVRVFDEQDVLWLMSIQSQELNNALAACLLSSGLKPTDMILHKIILVADLPNAEAAVFKLKVSKLDKPTRAVMLSRGGKVANRVAPSFLERESGVNLLYLVLKHADRYRGKAAKLLKKHFWMFEGDSNPDFTDVNDQLVEYEEPHHQEQRAVEVRARTEKILLLMVEHVPKLKDWAQGQLKKLP